MCQRCRKFFTTMRMKKRLIAFEMYPRILFHTLFSYLSFSIALLRYTTVSLSIMSLYSDRLCPFPRDYASSFSSLFFLRKWLRIIAMTMIRLLLIMLVCSNRGILSSMRSMTVWVLGF